MMSKSSNIAAESISTITLDIPPDEPRIFASQAVNELLSFLCRYHTYEFTITELTEVVDYSQASVSKAIDVLAANDLVTEQRDGNKRSVQINRERLNRPDDPFLQIPQSAFQEPVRAAVDALLDRIDDVVGIVVYGSVAQGAADRRSDIDLWVLVEEDRMASQRVANRVRQDLEDQTFDAERYAYEIDVEALPAVPNYADDVRKILASGITVYDTEKFDTLQTLLFHGEFDA